MEHDPREVARVFHYEHPALDGRIVLVVPFQGGWRLDIQARISDDPEYLSRDDVVADMVEKVMGEEYADRVTWVSTYQFLQVIADSFVDDHRRVLLAGEAAHLFAPFGARGMNSGIADADAAASAIKVAVGAEEPAVARAEVEKFAAERETAAEWNRDAAGAALRHLRGGGVVVNAKKRLAAEAAEWWEPAGEWLDEAPYGPSGGPPIPTSTKY
jgi:3-(3-hydroxy-phenyl)propionate hydroxylase